MYFYRDKDKKEIDLLIESADGFYPVEFKKSSTPKGEDAKHFSVLDKLKIKVKKHLQIREKSAIMFRHLMGKRTPIETSRTVLWLLRMNVLIIF